MKNCRYCTAEIPDEALKCKHCGEWVEQPSGGTGYESAQASLARAANRYVNLQYLGVLLGCVVPTIVVIAGGLLFYLFVYPNLSK